MFLSNHNHTDSKTIRHDFCYPDSEIEELFKRVCQKQLVFHRQQFGVFLVSSLYGHGYMIERYCSEEKTDIEGISKM